MIKNIEIKKDTKKSASTIVFVIFFFFMFLIFAAFGVDGTITLANRAELQYATEQAALAGASAFTSSKDAITGTTADVYTARRTAAEQAATSAFNLLNKGSLKNSTIEVSFPEDTSLRIHVATTMISQPFFLSFFGVAGINLSADAYATSEPLAVSSSYGTAVNWITQSASYLSDILSITANDSGTILTTNYRDTVILRPLGSNATISTSASFNSAEATVPMFSLINSADNHPLSLGPGGFITIKLPAPIIDKPGPDLYIREAGDALEGYFVFAGIDVNPYDPYVDAKKRGSGISWINISCSAAIHPGFGGTPEVPESDTPANVNIAYNALTNSTVLGYQNKFYGSAYFDLSDSCITGSTNGISVVKYIRIIDDNQETAFVSSPEDVINNVNPRHFYKTMLYGESSTSTAGADIDQVVVLNHVKLITRTQYEPDP